MNEPPKEYKSNKSFKRWSIALGVILIVLGLFTITVSPLTTLFTISFLGSVLAIRGGIDIVHTLTLQHHKGSLWHLSSGIFSLVTGILIILRPAATAAIVTFLVSAFLISSGLMRTISAPVEHRSQWGWIMLGGLVALILGISIIAAWPDISLSLIGLLVGVEILVQGMVIISLPYTLKYQGKPAGEAFSR